MRTLNLTNSSVIPLLGLGTWQLTGSTCVGVVHAAITIGYRHIDTAIAYGNQPEIGAAIKEHDINREELFITSKLWRDRLDTDGVREQTQQILNELQTEYIDLLLIHWPNKNIPIKETLQAMQEEQKNGRVKHIGVSNFTKRHLQEALDCNIPIVNNQVEYHPSLNQADLHKFCKENGVTMTAYSPLGRGDDLNLPKVHEIAKKYNKTESQVILNWLMQKNIITIPRSKNPKRLQDNFDALSWELDKDDIALVDSIDAWNRLIVPDFAEFGEEL